MTGQKGAETLTLEDARERIRELLTRQKKQQALVDHLSTLKGHGKVEVLLK